MDHRRFGVLAATAPAALAVVLFGVTELAAAQTTEQRLVAILQNGALTDRYEAARDALQIPSKQRSEALWVALANELQRVATDSHERTDALIAGRQVPSLGEIHSEYNYDLIKAVAEWRDPRALRPLISSAGRGMVAAQGILAFGERAVPLLIDAARNGHRSEWAGVLGTLQILLEGSPIEPYNIPPTPLSPAARQQILQLARELLQPKPGVWRDLPTEAALALATGDEELRQQVELLAREPGVVAQITGSGDANEIARVQRAIRARLDRRQITAGR